MFNKIVFFFLLLISFESFSQELNAIVTINSDNIPGSNKQVFITLEKDLTNFVNQKKWTETKYKVQEKIDCAFNIIILEQSSTTEFSGSIQIQAARPAYNSTYLSSTFNFKDNDLKFKYTEFENFEYNPNSFESNLISIIAFYAYTIIGVDADTFASLGGTSFFNQAENVVNLAQQSGYTGWTANSSGVTRYKIINEIQSPSNLNFRKSLYQYHFKGLDIMSENKELAKQNIADAVDMLNVVYDRKPNSPLIRLFMDAKNDEIVNIFSGGPRFETDDLIDDLMRLSPTNSSKWNEIK